MSEILDENRDSLVQHFKGESEEDQFELIMQRKEALKSLSDEELDEVHDALYEREGTLGNDIPLNEMIPVSDSKDFHLIQTLHFDMQLIYWEKVDRGLAPAINVATVAVY